MKFDKFVYLSDYPYLEKIVRLYMRLEFLTSNNTFMGMFNTKGNKVRKAQMQRIHLILISRIRRIIGEDKLYNFVESHEPRGLGDRKYLIMYKDR